MIKFFNTRSKSLEVFNPISPGKVTMYHCGPTVYARAHIGNLMPYVHWDVMRRLFEMSDYKVVQVMNFTDIGHIVSDADVGNDKMVNALQSRGKDLTIENLHEHGREIADQYLQDMDDLGIQRPHHLPFASKHIAEDIKIIQKLESKGLIYQTETALFLDTSKLNNYDVFDVHGDLDPEHQRLQNNSDKKNARDFALWKFSDPDSKIGWESPWGLGFPGWHIECSAMSWRYLGESFDIHTGGIEHIPIHHTNEIAQSEHAFESEMARYWLHNNLIQLNGEKIAKSEGNVVYLDELDARGFHPMDYRYLLLTSHYRTELNFTWGSLKSARIARKNIAKLLYEQASMTETGTKLDQSFIDQAIKLLSDDLNSAQVIAFINTHLQSDNIYTINYLLTNLLGITFSDLFYLFEPVTNPPQAVQELLEKRLQARENNNYELSDSLRDQITAYKYRVQDIDSDQILFHLD